MTQIPPAAADQATPATSDDEASSVRELARLKERLTEHVTQAATLLATADGVVRDARQGLEHDTERGRLDAAERAERAGASQRRRTGAEVAAAQAGLRGALDAWSSVMATGTWVDPRWGGAEPDELPDSAVRIGTFPARGDGALALVPSVGSGNVQVVAATPADRDRALGVVSSILLRTLASAPPGRVRFRIHDPIGLGATLSAYSQFDRQRIGHGNPTSDPRELEATLSALGTHATEVSATYLRGVHSTLRDCLRDDPHTDVAFEVLVLLDLPRGLERDLAERVSVLAGQAPARGVMVLTMQVGEVSGLDLGVAGLRVDVTGGAARIPQLGAAAVELDAPPPPMLLERLATRPIAGRATLTFASLHEGESGTESSAERIETAIGRKGREAISMRFGDDPVNALVAGIAGSGKSNLLRTMVYGLAHRYPASELHFYLLDFKEGVEFQEFAPTRPDRTFLPHATVVSVNSSREFGLEVLRHLNGVIAERYALFSSTGCAPKLKALREARPDLPLPRLLLVVDEFQRMFDTDDALSTAAVDNLLNIAKQGRAAGVHFVLATQSIGDVGAGTSVGLRLDGVFKNAALRVGMRLSEAESRQIFSSSTNTEAATIHESGVAIVNASGGAEAFNDRTVVAYLADDVALAERQKAVARTTVGRIPPRTFDGAAGADPASNRALRSAVRGRGNRELWRCWPAQALRVGLEDPRGAQSVETSLGRDPRRNIAIIGAGFANAISMVQWSVVGLAASRPTGRYVLVDLLRGEDVAEYGIPVGVVAATAAVLGRLGVTAEVVREDRAGALADLLRGAPGGDVPTVVACFGGLERLRGRGETPDPDNSYVTAEDILRRRLREGPNDDVHAIASFGTRDDFEALDRDNAFGLRAYLQLPAIALSQLSGADTAVPTGRLALWHDLFTARAPEPVHCYSPFGTGDEPEWLTR